MDTPETLAAALLKTTVTAVGETRRIVQKGALNIKTEWKSNVEASAPTRNAGAAATISYDTTIRPTTVEAQIGYDKDKFKAAGKKTGPGGLGNLLEFGGGKDHSPPHRDGARALESEEPRFLNALDLMAGRLL